MLVRNDRGSVSAARANRRDRDEAGYPGRSPGDPQVAREAAGAFSGAAGRAPARLDEAARVDGLGRLDHARPRFRRPADLSTVAVHGAA
jgi:hypothetical protein